MVSISISRKYFFGWRFPSVDDNTNVINIEIPTQKQPFSGVPQITYMKFC